MTTENRPITSPLTYFFVRGYMRSGTTWTRTLLNTHPDVVCGGEFNLANVHLQVDHITSTLHWCEGACDEFVREEMWAGFHEWVRRTLRSISPRKEGATVLGDCTPHAIFGILPGAKYIRLLRDGRDVLVSWTHHALSGEEAPDESVFPSVGRLASLFGADERYFLDHPEELLSDETWVRHIARNWADRFEQDNAMIGAVRDGSFDASCELFTYEQIHADTQGERARMFRFLGVDPALASRLSEENRTSAGFSSESPASHFRRGRPGDWNRYMTGASARWFREEAGHALIEAGYERDDEWTRQDTINETTVHTAGV